MARFYKSRCEPCGKETRWVADDMGGLRRRDDHCTECGLTVWDWNRVAEERRVLDEMGALAEQVDFTEVGGDGPLPCPLCRGTRVVRWGTRKLGGKEGPCLCTPEGKRFLGR